MKTQQELLANLKSILKKLDPTQIKHALGKPKPPVYYPSFAETIKNLERHCEILSIKMEIDKIEDRINQSLKKSRTTQQTSQAIEPSMS
jgi:hypothetical protein